MLMLNLVHSNHIFQMFLVYVSFSYLMTSKVYFSDNSCFKEPLMRQIPGGEESEVKVILRWGFSENFGCLVFSPLKNSWF